MPGLGAPTWLSSASLGLGLRGCHPHSTQLSAQYDPQSDHSWSVQGWVLVSAPGNPSLRDSETQTERPISVLESELWAPKFVSSWSLHSQMLGRMKKAALGSERGRERERERENKTDSPRGAEVNGRVLKPSSSLDTSLLMTCPGSTKS